jgi:hypothetical protein
MDVIAAPIPETGADGPITSLPPPIGDTRPWWLWVGLVGALTLGMVIGWLAATSSQPDQPAPIDLTSTLDWMFSASLTYSAVTEEGLEIPPPAQTVRVREVDILDPVRGPILAIVDLDQGGSVDTVAYEITTRRSGRAWSVEATPLADTLTPPGN